MEKFSFTVIDPVGLHARPATILVNQASKFKATVEIQAEGDDEKDAIDSIKKVVVEQKVAEEVE